MVQITEQENDLHIKAPQMLCDGELGDIPYPIPKNHFFMIVAGSAGSGKTSFLISLLSQKKPPIFRKVFENIFVVAPPHSLASIKSNIFRNHAQDKIYNELTPENLTDIKDKVLKEANDGFNSLLIIDDMTVYLKDKMNEKYELEQHENHFLLMALYISASLSVE